MNSRVMSWTRAVLLALVPALYVLGGLQLLNAHALTGRDLCWYLWLIPYAAASIAWCFNPTSFPLISKVLVVITAISMVVVAYGHSA